MSVTTTQSTDSTVQVCRSFLQDLLGGYRQRNFAVRFWDGSQWDAEAGQPTRFTLILNHPASLRRMFWPPRRITLGEAYIYNDFDLDGDMETFAGVLKYIKDLRPTWSLGEKLRWGLRLFRLPSNGPPRGPNRSVSLKGTKHSLDRDQKAVTYHYDVSNDFYALWLDQRMCYTCAYFGTPDDDIDTAQERKVDYVCRKLRLRPGERMLDVGCGWGGLTIHAGKHYGAHVLGITISKPQADLANERIRKAGLADRCRVEVLDYRAINDPNGFDKIAAIGILEHVGEAKLPAYFQQAWNLLKPGGVFLSHGIAMKGTDKMPTGPSFSNKYVFPDGELVPLHVNLRAAEKTGFEVRDVESLRDHYVLTLRHWVRRLEEHADEARALTDEFTYRVYRAYMSASVHLFKICKLNLYQALLAKTDRGRSGLPLTREDWYAKPIITDRD